MNFFKRVLSTVVGIFVFFILCSFILFFIGVSISKMADKEVKIDKNTVLELKLDFPVNDNSGVVEYKDFSFMNDTKREGLFDLITAIEYAATDDNIKGITIESNFIQAGITQTKAIREALIRFKESGKFVTAYSDIYTQKDYYLSSVADTIFVNPVGSVDFRGLATELLYLKDFQDKYGVKMNVVRVGKYKSAVEPLLENEMSQENKEQILSYLSSIWTNLRQEIGASRDIDSEYLDIIANDLLARTPEKALEVGLVDKIAYHSEYETSLRNALSINEKDKISRINILEYTDHIGLQDYYKYNKNKIAIIYAQGEIIYGEGSVQKVGPKEVNEAIIKAKNDENTKAIVLRVNSPGGSALSSELIWKELEEAKKVKPVIVSMGDVAASGGYYIAAGADKIFAEPTTITGSIGVFGTLPNVKGLTDKMGIHAHQVTTNDNAIPYSLFNEMTENQEAFIREGVLDVYDLFKTRVSQGRGMSMDEVEEIAQGRVWTGEEALDIGLVDEMGGLQEAINYAVQQADIESYQIKEYPVFKVDVMRVLRRFGLTQTAEEFSKELLGEEVYKILEHTKTQTERKGVQMIFPYSTEIN